MKRGLPEGWRVLARGISVDGTSLVGAAAEATADRITVRVRFVPAAGAAKSVRGHRVVEWLEDWTFTRTVVLPADKQASIRIEPWQLQSMQHVAMHLAA